MKERPILFSGPMVRAILEGRKTQTRRIIKPQPAGKFLSFLERPIRKSSDLPVLRAWFQAGKDERSSFEVTCPYGKPGDRLWVRETWWQGQGPTWGTNCVVYDADKAIGWAPGSGFDNPDLTQFKKRPSIFMPRWASRITLEITGIRVERLQQISRADAIAEGIERVGGEFSCHPWRNYLLKPFAHPTGHCSSSQRSYMTLWESIHGAGSWDVNPWVWVVEFRRLTEGDGGQ